METRVLYQGKYIRLMAQGNWEYAERVNCSGVVFIVACTDDGKMILCEQYRVPVGKNVIEIPAGLVNDGASDTHETMEAAAKRELLEETGYVADEMIEIVRGPAAPGSSSVIITFFQAKGLKKVGPGGGDDAENIKVHEIPLAEMDEWIGQQLLNPMKFVDPKIYVGLYFLKNRTKS